VSRNCLIGLTSTSGSIIEPERKQLESSENMPIFYRVLTPDCEGVPGTIQRWFERRFTSSHSRPPGQWTEIWDRTRSPNPEDYPLEVNGCTSTVEARGAFLQLAPTHQPGDLWPDDELNRVGEYEGVSAFDDNQRALVYGQGAPGKLYVVFEGERLFTLPEDDGYSVSVTRELVPPMPVEAFRRWVAEGCQVPD
jgi:hypothetical protein